MKHHKIRGFAITLLMLLVPGMIKAAFAGNPVVHISPKPTWLSVCKPYDKSPPARSIENGYYLALVERQIDVERQADYRHTIRQIVSEAGVQDASQISVSFDPSYERLDFHHITVWRDNKPQNRLNPADFKVIADEEDFSKFIYQGSYSANYIIPDIRKGDRIEYDFTITGRNPVFDYKYCDDIYLQGGQPIAHQYVMLQTSSCRKLNVKPFNKVPTPVISETNGSKSYIWENYQVPAADDENGQAGWYNPYARVQVSQYNTWAEVINWALKVNPISTHLKGELAQRVAKLKAEAGNDKEKYFRSAVKLVQDEVRYMGIEIGEYSHRANHPENVFNQRYGDCKDKALLLASILRANGIPADMVLVNTSLQDKIDQLLPTTDAFNHAVVVATVNSKQVWVDATIAYQSGKGTDLYFPNYGKGLQLKPRNNSLVVIPITPTGKITCHEKYTVAGIKGKTRLDVTTTYTLNQADDVRARLASSGIYTAEKNYLKYYAKLYPKVESHDSLIVKDNEDKNELTTVESYLIPEFLKQDTTATGRYEAGFYANSIDEQLPSINGQTKNPVSLYYPYAIDYTIEVSLPSGWDVKEKNYSLKRDAYKFESDYTTAGNSLFLHYQFAYLKDFIPVDKLEQARQDVSLLKDSKLSYSFTFTPATGNTTGSGPHNLNGWMVAMAIALLALCTGLAIWIYHIETPAIVFSPGASFVPIGGWLILIIIGLFATPLNVMNIFFQGNYFSMSQWNAYANHTGSTTFRAILIWETVGNIIVFCLAVFCLVLLLNKRDILPKVITWYFGFAVVLGLVDYLLANNLGDRYTHASSFALFRSILIAAIWIPYFRVSTRVHETFIVPHPPYNYSYEKPSDTAE